QTVVAIAGAALLVTAALLVDGAPGPDLVGVPAVAWASGLAGLLLLARAWRRTAPPVEAS
ncbi:MAG: hypothetical protein ACOC3U_00170, partial [Thiohalospira sp.]